MNIAKKNAFNKKNWQVATTVFSQDWGIKCTVAAKESEMNAAEVLKYIDFLDYVNPLGLNDFDYSEDGSDLLIEDSVPWTNHDRFSSSDGDLESKNDGDGSDTSKNWSHKDSDVENVSEMAIMEGEELEDWREEEDEV